MADIVFSPGAAVCPLSSASCSSPDGSVSCGGTKSGCLRATDWKYYKVPGSAGKKVTATLTFSGTGCNVNDLYIYNSSCSRLYNSSGNLWTEAWTGTSSTDIIIGIDGDSSNQNCQWNLSVSCVSAVGEKVWASCENGTLSGPVAFNYSMGYKFTANTNGQVTKLCGFFSGTKWVRLYNSSYSILTSAQVTSSANWSCTSISPVNITSGSVYYVVAEMASSGAYYRNGISLAGCTNDITINAAVYQTPSGTFNSSHYETTANMYGMADIVF